MKKTTAIVILILTIISKICYAIPVGPAFNYQGELTVDGSPGNGQYTLTFQLFDSPGGNNNLSGLITEFVDVTNGLFNVNLDFGESNYTGEEVWIEIAVSVFPGIEEEYLPRQKINAVPYAVQAKYLDANGAQNGDLLQFDGTDWVPASVQLNSPWVPDGESLMTSYNKIIVGDTGSHQSTSYYFKGAAGLTLLEVANPSGVQLRLTEIGKLLIGDGLLAEGKIETNDTLEVSGTSFFNDNVGIGTENPTADLFIEGSNDGDLIRARINSSTKFIVNSTGKVGIGTSNPAADLTVEGTNDGDLIRAQIDGTTKLVVDSDGHVGIGQATPSSQLEVVSTSSRILNLKANGLSKMTVDFDGEATFYGDTKQSAQSEGMLKYMLFVYCGNASQINRSFNGTTNLNSMSIANGSTDGECVITFPNNVNDRFWAVSASSSAANRSAKCYASSANQLTCNRIVASTGTGANGSVSILVY